MVVLPWVCTRRGEGDVAERGVEVKRTDSRRAGYRAGGRQAGTVCAVFSSVPCRFVNCVGPIVSLVLGYFYFSCGT